MNLTIHYLAQILALAKEHSLAFKNLTRLCEFCATYISSQRADSPPISVTTLTRNPVYRAMIDQYLENMTDGESHIIIRHLQIANANLRNDIKRLKTYALSLEDSRKSPTLAHSPEIASTVDLEKSSLVKTVDLLLAYFADHVEIDSKTSTIICPYLKSSERLIVPAVWAKAYLLLKSIERVPSG
ncbi:hypothetical protein [Pseudomonas sp. Y24-6]|uniref:hypothetical protein n=1 Tax=Pseudomonas sp. Y24-6 TaxID=2750013 RepID=UPI001CE1FEAA|nr:hypothetical protein [Pseudomonas sp. Y24-6]MCA4964109.1 hypothetical protein [Pseudomonas sp. Y24-6]